MDNLISRFRQHVALRSNSIAVQDDTLTLTFQQLDHWSSVLTHHISSRSNALKASGHVAICICIPRSTLLLVSILAVVKAGFAYVPLDPLAPLARVEDQLSQCDAQLLLVASGLTDVKLSGLSELPLTFDIASIVTVLSGHHHKQPSSICVDVDNTALLAILFTSGSTGRPKGVLIEHASMINLVDGPTLEIQPGDRVALTANPSFDAASFEIWNSLVHGATIFILTAHLADTDAVAAFFREKRIQKAFLPTAVFHRLFGDANVAASLNATLRMINIGGEKLSTTVAKTFLRHAPDVRLTNGYGSTETTVCATLFEVTQEALQFDDETSRPIPIGSSIPNTGFFLLDEDLHPVDFGHPGEICISGAALARGYLDSSSVSSAKFTTVMGLGESSKATRIYRTGDIGKLVSSPRGPMLEYVGRNDNQVKIRGQRLEPGEIEAVLCSRGHGIGQAAVVVTENDRMLAFVVKKDAEDEKVRDDAVKFTVNQNAWDAFQAQYDWESIDSTMTGRDFTGWVSMYDGVPISRSAMEEWLTDTLDSIPLEPNDSALEVGCGTGMLLFSLEPRCKEYIGIDMSGHSLAFVEAQIKNRGLTSKVQTIQGMADQLPRLLPVEKQVDLIIINSVVQYFPSGDYLENVLRHCADKLNDGGRIFLGDIRSLGLDVHHDLARVLHCDPSPDLSTFEIQERLESLQYRQNELKVNPSFFFQFQEKLDGRISHVEILPKLMTTHNELSQFRYQVVLHIGSQPPPLAAPTQWIEYSSISDLKYILGSSSDQTLAVRGIPNSLVARQEVILRLLRDSKPPLTALGLTQAAAAADWCVQALSPYDITSIGIEYGWHVELSWKSLGVDRTLAAVFSRTCSDIKADFGNNRIDDEPASTPDTSTAVPGSDPGTLAVRLQALCREKLPSYMVPDHVIFKDTLPLTSNGKVDRRMLAQPTYWAQDVDFLVQQVDLYEPQNDTQARLQRCVGEVLELDALKVPLETPLIELGLHSFRAPKLLASVQAEFGFGVVSYSTIYKYPSVIALSSYLEQRLQSHSTENQKLESTNTRKRCEVTYDQGALDEILRARGLTADDVEDVYGTTTTQKMCLRDPWPMAHELWTAHTDLDTLLRALDTAVSRHGILRTTFLQEGTHQVVFRHSKRLCDEIITISDAMDIQSIRKMLQHDPRYLLKPPYNLFHLEVFRSNPPTVLCYFQQATIDAWTRDRLLTEIESTILGHSLPEPVPFRNFVDFESKEIKNPAHAAWLASKLANVDAVPFPFDDASSGYITRSILGPNVEREEHIDGLEQVLRAFGIQASTILKIAMALVLRRETKRDSVAFGQIHFCRNAPVEGIAEICGLTLSPLIDFVDFKSNETVLEMLHRTQSAQHEFMDMSLVDMEEVQRLVGKDITSFFRFAWNLRSETQVTSTILQPGPSGFDTDLAIAWTTIVNGERVKVEVDYDDLFSERMKTYVDQFFIAARWLVANIESKSMDKAQLNQ